MDEAHLAAALRYLALNQSIGRPLGDADFLTTLEARSGRALQPRRRGPKPKSALSPQSR